jgi:hypothetical protein
MFPHTDRDYATVAADVTLGSLIDDLDLPAPLVGAPSTSIDGQRAFGVSAKMKVSGQTVTATLYARATGTPLPIEEVSTDADGRSTTTFSGWDEPLHVTVPADAVPISSTGLE